MIGQIAGAIIGGGINALTNQQNNLYAEERERDARKENFMYGERAADNADARFRSQFNDMFSYSAQLQQLKKAGMSPSVLYANGAAGQGGSSGMQGSGAGSVQPTIFGMNALEGAQIANLMAQTANIKADTENKELQTKRDNLQYEIERFKKQLFDNEYDILMTTDWGNNEKGEPQSLQEIAMKCSNFDDFIKVLRKNTWEQADKTSYYKLYQEQSINQLRNIFKKTKELHKEINAIELDETNIELAIDITKELQKADYAKANATEVVQTIKRNIEESKLEESQKKAFNDLLDKIGEKSQTAKDALIILSLIFDRYATKLKSKESNTTVTYYQKNDNQ